RAWASLHRPAQSLFESLLCQDRIQASGLHTRAVTNRDTLSEGFSHFVTSIAAPAASGWSVAGWDLHPLESAALSRRTPTAVIGLRICCVAQLDLPFRVFSRRRPTVTSD